MYCILPLPNGNSKKPTQSIIEPSDPEITSAKNKNK